MSKQRLSGSAFLKDPEQMLSLYARGAFPMADESGIIEWYFPQIRTIIPLNNFNTPRSLRKIIPRLNFEVRFDTDFFSVVRSCADREETWISEEIIEAYLRLKKLGHIHTVETWKENKLAGGLYGVTFRGAFFGESMFSRVPQASKFALIKLIEHLNEKNFTLLDVQFMTEHLKMFGAKEISFEEYQRILQKAYSKDCKF
ncbi:MAG: leucyl/phenylalanyl-tRNA--protein transferase [Ignavibacteriaceae bacterium]